MQLQIALVWLNINEFRRCFIGNIQLFAFFYQRRIKVKNTLAQALKQSTRRTLQVNIMIERIQGLLICIFILILCGGISVRRFGVTWINFSTNAKWLLIPFCHITNILADTLPGNGVPGYFPIAIRNPFATSKAVIMKLLLIKWHNFITSWYKAC